MTDYQINGTFWMCPSCHSPILLGGSLPKQKVTIWGSPEHPLLTTHTPECQAQPPYRNHSWGVGPYDIYTVDDGDDDDDDDDAGDESFQKQIGESDE